MGEMLAKRVLAVCGESHGVDVVVPIPETSRTVRTTSYNLQYDVFHYHSLYDTWL